MLDFSAFSWYNNLMENEKKTDTSSTEMIQISRAEYEKFQADQAYIAELEKQVNWLMEQMNLLKRKKFGSGSEKASEEVMEQMSLFFDEPEATAYVEQHMETQVKAHTRKKASGSVRDIIPENIPVEEVIHELPEDQRKCPQCGDEMVVIGKEVRESLKIKPAEAILRRDIYYTYACKSCEKKDISTPVVKAPKEPALISGSFAAPETVAYLAIQKYVMGSPLYRQEQEWNCKGIKLSRQTMSDWLLRCSKDWLEPVYEVLKEQLVARDLIHSDETSIQVLHETDKTAQSKSSMWLYRTGSDAEHPIVLYEYQPGKSSKYPQEFLKGFKGYLQTDGAAYYHDIEHAVSVGCWAHARRKFDEAIKSQSKGKRSPTAEQGVAFCSKLFALEKEYADEHFTFEERKQQRLERSKPILDDLLSWAGTRTAAPKSKLGVALTYLKNQWVPLNSFLLDGRIEISNNRAERSIKPFVMSRKNFLFANTPLGAQSSAVIFSLIETAKENGLDPYRYLTFVLSEAPKRSQQSKNWAETLVPESAPDSCKAIQ